MSSAAITAGVAYPVTALAAGPSAACAFAMTRSTLRQLHQYRTAHAPLRNASSAVGGRPQRPGPPEADGLRPPREPGARRHGMAVAAACLLLACSAATGAGAATGLMSLHHHAEIAQGEAQDD
ncbi:MULTISPECIES: hypothetical protein [unclassified Streptomyces]|uniref:hypothetical protein n=1 Tax=unclassified Streptomyces TaxID=2593676 RepID=UPI0009404FDD|nr:hypothetical protein [Streptomyces sp. TSRI0281]OKI43438.1 hypothetical protein A6A29_08970 [Streptomyces sp. TSRI0281]